MRLLPPFTGLVCRHCARPVAVIVKGARLALTCRACGYSWIVPGAPETKQQPLNPPSHQH